MNGNRSLSPRLDPGLCLKGDYGTTFGPLKGTMCLGDGPFRVPTRLPGARGTEMMPDATFRPALTRLGYWRIAFLMICRSASGKVVPGASKGNVTS